MKRMPPVTKAELANVDGMGGQRVAISGEAILATIYAFLEVCLNCAFLYCTICLLLTLLCHHLHQISITPELD